MTSPFPDYPASALSLLALGALIVTQVAVATAATRAAGQVPGMPLTIGHESFAFRAFRAHQNTLENTAPFVAALVAAMLVGAAPMLVEAAALVFVGARLAHAGAYYAGVEAPRTAAFGVGLLAMVALLGAAFVALVS